MTDLFQREHQDFTWYNLPGAAPETVSSSGALGLGGHYICVHEEALPFLSQLCQSIFD